MELKLIILNLLSAEHLLLIVPYGIETSDNLPGDGRDVLLIVPYGIETRVCSLSLGGVLPF